MMKNEAKYIKKIKWKRNMQMTEEYNEKKGKKYENEKKIEDRN